MRCESRDVSNVCGWMNVLVGWKSACVFTRICRTTTMIIIIVNNYPN